MQWEMADFALGATTWRSKRNINVVFDSVLFCPWKHDVVHKTGNT